MAKTKNVQDFSPAATRIYNAAKKGIVNRTNSSHVKRVIDSELDKHSLSKEKVQKEISDNVGKACATTVTEVKKSFEEQILEFENEVKDLKSGAKTFVKAATKELEDEKSILELQVKALNKESNALSKENDSLVERVNSLTEQVVNLKTPPPGPSDPAGPTDDDQETDLDQEKESSGKKK